MNLYHWHVEAGGRTADYLVVAVSRESARKLIIDQIGTPGGSAYAAAGHGKFVAENEPFVAAPGYPIVLF